MFWYKYMGISPTDWLIPTAIFSLIVPFAIIDIVLKGFALWRSAQRKEKGWFIAILIVNSLGILPGIYLLTHTKKK